MSNTLNEYPGLFIFGVMFIIYEVYRLVNARFVTWLMLFNRDFKEKTHEEKHNIARSGDIPTALLPLGIITISYLIWAIWCCFIPTFQMAGFGVVLLMIVSNQAMSKTNNENRLVWLLRADAVAALAVMGVCAYWM